MSGPSFPFVWARLLTLTSNPMFRQLGTPLHTAPLFPVVWRRLCTLYRHSKWYEHASAQCAPNLNGLSTHLRIVPTLPMVWECLYTLHSHFHSRSKVPKHPYATFHIQPHVLSEHVSAHCTPFPIIRIRFCAIYTILNEAPLLCYHKLQCARAVIFCWHQDQIRNRHGRYLPAIWSGNVQMNAIICTICTCPHLLYWIYYIGQPSIFAVGSLWGRPHNRLDEPRCRITLRRQCSDTNCGRRRRRTVTKQNSQQGARRWL